MQGTFFFCRLALRLAVRSSSSSRSLASFSCGILTPVQQTMNSTAPHFTSPHTPTSRAMSFCCCSKSSSICFNRSCSRRRDCSGKQQTMSCRPVIPASSRHACLCNATYMSICVEFSAARPCVTAHHVVSAIRNYFHDMAKLDVKLLRLSHIYTHPGLVSRLCTRLLLQFNR